MDLQVGSAEVGSCFKCRFLSGSGAAADRDLDADADADIAGRVEMRWSVGIRKPSVLPLPVLARTRKSREPSSNFGKYDACGADMNS